jgi:2-hydroxy-3-keto-5-methylthiopentenyl-1-phosphate phosphatase
VRALLIACDFDGTITRRDTLHVIVEAFGTRGIWAALEPRLRAGEITVEEAMEQEFGEVRASREEVLAAVRERAPIRAGFAELVDWSEARGHRVVVVSNGFRTVIDAVLGDAGLGRLEVASHEASFSPDGCRLSWSDRGERCSLCGRRCKRYEIERRLRGERLVYLGDGISDRCAVGMADVAFARDGLAEHLRERGVPFLPFEDFHDVRRTLESMARDAA